jgi:hypothetical protein
MFVGEGNPQRKLTGRRSTGIGDFNQAIEISCNDDCAASQKSSQHLMGLVGLFAGIEAIQHMQIVVQTASDQFAH